MADMTNASFPGSVAPTFVFSMSTDVFSENGKYYVVQQRPGADRTQVDKMTPPLESHEIEDADRKDDVVYMWIIGNTLNGPKFWAKKAISDKYEAFTKHTQIVNDVSCSESLHSLPGLSKDTCITNVLYAGELCVYAKVNARQPEFTFASGTYMSERDTPSDDEIDLVKSVMMSGWREGDNPMKVQYVDSKTTFLKQTPHLLDRLLDSNAVDVFEFDTLKDAKAVSFSEITLVKLNARIEMALRSKYPDMADPIIKERDALVALISSAKKVSHENQASVASSQAQVNQSAYKPKRFSVGGTRRTKKLRFRTKKNKRQNKRR